ncbi:MAG: dodecin family protein [Candidatus Methanofastidiosia archaeon]
MDVVKVIELIGYSEDSFQDAVENAVETASKTVKNIVGVDVRRFKGSVEDGKITKYKANVKIAFVIKG